RSPAWRGRRSTTARDRLAPTPVRPPAARQRARTDRGSGAAVLQWNSYRLLSGSPSMRLIDGGSSCGRRPKNISKTLFLPITRTVCSLRVESRSHGEMPQLFFFGEDFQSSRAHGFLQCCMVAFALIGIGDRERCNGFVEGVAPAEIAADLCRCTGAGVRARQRPGTDLGVLAHHARTEQLDHGPDLHVPELADVEIPAGLALRPAEEDVARRLHQSVAVYNPLAMIAVDALAGVRLQDRGPRLLDLEEQGVLFARHQQRHGAEGADAANPDHLDGDVLELIAVDEHPPVFLHAVPIAGKGRVGAREQIFHTLFARVIDERRVVPDRR